MAQRGARPMAVGASTSHAEAALEVARNAAGTPDFGIGFGNHLATSRELSNNDRVVSRPGQSCDVDARGVHLSALGRARSDQSIDGTRDPEQCHRQHVWCDD